MSPLSQVCPKNRIGLCCESKCVLCVFNRWFAFDVIAAVFPHILTYMLLQVNWEESGKIIPSHAFSNLVPGLPAQLSIPTWRSKKAGESLVSFLM